jgi:RecJ-like exonuclease
MGRPQWQLATADRVGALRELLRNQPPMTDPITCPECQGAKGQRIGGLFLACQFCRGRGIVGGEHEPAEPPPPPASPSPAWEHRVWLDPHVAATLPCRYCLGSGEVSQVNQQARTLVSGPCICRVPSE